MIATIFQLCLAASLGAGGHHAQNRALWVWHGQPIIQNAGERRKFFAFLEAPKGDPKARISVIFLSRMGIENSGNAKAIGSFILEAHRRSIRVDYLCGEATYASPEHRKEGLWQLQYVVKYNRHARLKERFDGIQYDVEPYMMPGWPSGKMIQNYLDFLAGCRQRIDETGRPLQLGAAIPRWFDEKKLHDLYRSVLNKVDYVAVMDYVDSPESFVADAENTVRYASSIGKDVWLGAEATELPTEPHATFFRLGNAAMEKAFLAASRAYGSEKGFAGVAVEYYETYQALRP